MVKDYVVVVNRGQGNTLYPEGAAKPTFFTQAEGLELVAELKEEAGSYWDRPNDFEPRFGVCHVSQALRCIRYSTRMAEYLLRVEIANMVHTPWRDVAIGQELRIDANDREVWYKKNTNLSYVIAWDTYVLQRFHVYGIACADRSKVWVFSSTPELAV